MKIKTPCLSGHSIPLPVLLSIRKNHKRIMTEKELEDARKRAARNMVHFCSDKLLYPFWRGLFNYYKKQAEEIR